MDMWNQLIKKHVAMQQKCIDHMATTEVRPNEKGNLTEPEEKLPVPDIAKKVATWVAPPNVGTMGATTKGFWL